jgi:hypothetical protein
MNTMNMPGFTAQLSLVTSKERHRECGNGKCGEHALNAIVPQYCPCGDGTFLCCVGNDDCNNMFTAAGGCFDQAACNDLGLCGVYWCWGHRAFC